MKLSINPHYAAPVIALALSLPLMQVKNVVTVFAGGVGMAASVGYLSSALLLSDERKKSQQAIARTKKHLDTREQELSVRFKNASADLQKQLQQAIADREKTATAAKAQVDAIHSQRRHLLDEAKAAMSDEMRREFEAEYQRRFEQNTADFSRREDEFYYAEKDLLEHVEKLQLLTTNQENYLKEEFYKATSAKNEKFSASYKELMGEVEKYGEVLQLTSSEALEELRQKDLAIARLKGQVELLAAPRMFRGSSIDDATANKVIKFFIEKKVPMEVNDFDRRMDLLIVKFFPQGETTTAQVIPLMEELQLRLGLYALPTVAVENNLITIICQTDAKVASKLKIVEPPLSKLEKAWNEMIHGRVVSASGGGKTTFLGNCINYLVGRSGEAIKGDDFAIDDYVLCDPKGTNPDNWGTLTPHYYANECLEPFFSLTKTCKDRIDEAVTSIKATRSLPNFDIQFHVFDELELLYGWSEISTNKDHTPKNFKLNAKTMLKVGREHKLKLLFVTQSPLCTDLNLRRNDFENCSSFFLNGAISAALQSTGEEGLLRDVPSEKIALLKAEYEARLRRGDEFLFMAFNPAKPIETFIGKSPDVGHYAAISTAGTAGTDKNENPDLGGVAPRTLLGGADGATQVLQGFEQGTDEGTEGTGESTSTAAVPSSTTAVPSASTTAVPSSTELDLKLNQGTHCPSCGHHSNSYAKPTPNTKGNVSVKCKNSDCSKKTFSWKVV